MNELRIIVAGSRDFNDYKLLRIKMRELLLDKLYEKDSNITKVCIISGTARGADQLGERLARELNLHIKRFPADWSLGKRAGYIRNEKMAEYAVQDDSIGILMAFWDGESRGTQHMINLARKHGLEVNVIKYKEKQIEKIV